MKLFGMTLFEKDASSERQFKGRTQPTSVSGMLVVEGSFDFLEGGFNRAEKYRRGMLTVTLITAALLVLLVMLGLYFRSVAANSTDQAAQAASSTTAALSELAVLDVAGGFTAEELRAHAAVRAPVYKAAVSGEVDMVAMYSSITAALPGPMSLNSVSTMSEVAPAPTASAQPSPAPSATPSAAGAAAGAAAPTTKVTIVATAPSLEDANLFRDNLARTPGFAQLADPTWTGTQGSWTVTIVATLGTELYTKRAQVAAEADEFGLPKPSPSPTTAATPGGTVPAPSTNGAP